MADFHFCLWWCREVGKDFFLQPRKHGIFLFQGSIGFRRLGSKFRIFFQKILTEREIFPPGFGNLGKQIFHAVITARICRHDRLVIGFSFREVTKPPVVMSPSQQHGKSFDHLAVSRNDMFAQNFGMLFYISILLGIRKPIHGI